MIKLIKSQPCAKISLHSFEYRRGEEEQGGVAFASALCVSNLQSFARPQSRDQVHQHDAFTLHQVHIHFFALDLADFGQLLQ